MLPDKNTSTIAIVHVNFLTGRNIYLRLFEQKFQAICL